MPRPGFDALLQRRVRQTPDLAALIHSDSGLWRTLSWQELDAQVSAVTDALLSQNVARGERIALVSRSCLEWALIDFGALRSGAITVPIPSDLGAEGMRDILSESGATLALVEDERLLERFRPLVPGSAIRRVVAIRGPVHMANEIGWEAFLQAGRAHRAEFPTQREARIDSVEADQPATLVFTSGTTGRPKGVLLTHDNLIFEAEALNEVMRDFIEEQDVHYLCLPLSHILPRCLLHAAVVRGYTTAFASAPEALERDVGEIRPHFVTVVPAILERLHAAISRHLARQGALARRLTDWYRAINTQVASRRENREPVAPGLWLRHRLADRLVRGEVEERFGGRLKFFVCGGAALSSEVAEFFRSLGILVLEGYGLTENAGAANVNRPDRFRAGTVGTALPGMEQRIAPDGEILLRGRNVMQGYYRDPTATAEVLDGDGWLHTGDIGHLSPEGFLTVTDRKKDILVTASGRKVSPQHIETLLRTSPYIDQAVVIGEGREFLTALVTLDPEHLQRFAEENGLAFDKLSELALHPDIRALIAREIEERNRRLAGFEAVRRFSILPEPLTLSQGELTPTLKVRRHEVEERHRDCIEMMYASGPSGKTAE